MRRRLVLLLDDRPRREAVMLIRRLKPGFRTKRASANRELMPLFATPTSSEAWKMKDIAHEPLLANLRANDSPWSAQG